MTGGGYINTIYDREYQVIKLVSKPEHSERYTLTDLTESARMIWYSLFIICYAILANIAYNTEQSPPEMKTILEILIITNVYIAALQLSNYKTIKSYVIYNKNIISKGESFKDCIEVAYMFCVIYRFAVLIFERK